MKRNLLLVLFVMPFFLSSCVRQFKTNDYEYYAKDHQTIAILPYEIIVMGNRYRDVSEEDMNRMLLNDSELFHTDLHDQLLKKTGRKKDPVLINIQPYYTTMNILRDQGIDALNIKEYSPEALGELLEVDAVLRPKLFTEKFLSRTEAFVISTILDMAGGLLDVVGLSTHNRAVVKASDTKVVATIEDTQNSVVLWRYDNKYEQDWTDEIDEDIASVNRNLAKYFPYRSK